MLAWSLVAVILNKASLGGRLGPIVPGSPAIPLWSHKVGNLAVHAVTALAFLWLVPSLAGRYRQLIIGLGIVVLLVVATQNRGGLVAALAALAVLFLLSSRRAGLIAALVTTVAAVLVLGWSLNVHVKGEHDRTVSVSQLTENVGSLTGHSQADKNLQATAAWRNELWTSVIHKIRDEHKVVTGLGFGPDIAKELGFQGQATETLRSPHNSHLDVFARMGILGAALWVGLWATWYGVAWRGRSRLHALGRHIEAGLVEVSLVGVTAILVNAYFDPTLESPQVAIWLWTLVGLSLGIIRAGRLAATARSSTVR
jgi:O-antigen ligase